MPIVSSIIIRNEECGNGKRSVHEHHTDHTGKIHDHFYRCPVDYDTTAALADWAIKLPLHLADKEKEEIREAIEKGIDPISVEPTHLTNAQALRQIVKTAMNMKAEDTILTAEFVDTLTDAQLDDVFNSTIRQRIRTRITGILALKASLEADAALREEL